MSRKPYDSKRSILEDINRELKEEAKIPQYQLLTGKEYKRRNLLASGFIVFAFILPFIMVSNSSETIAAAGCFLGAILLIIIGISFIRSKVYWNHRMSMSFRAKQRDSIAAGGFLVFVGVIEFAIAVIILTIGL